MKATSLEIKRKKATRLTLGYLFVTFVKIGCLSFGGNIALIAMVQRILVDQDEVLENDHILDGITIASILPGPMAVNVVTYVGYQLKGKQGALVSFIAVLLPATLLMACVSWMYFSFALTLNWTNALQFLTAPVAAIVLTTGINLYKKEIKYAWTDTVVALVAATVLYYSSNYTTTVLLLIAGALYGSFKYRTGAPSPGRAAFRFKINAKNSLTAATLIILGINLLMFFTGTFSYLSSKPLMLLSVFSGISLSLFGGGYVMIPIMQTLFVDSLHWLRHREFIDSIAFAQASPGPILVNATFVGYKLGGWAGAVAATIGMFIPPASLMLIVGRGFKSLRSYQPVQHIISGLKVVIIGLIISSAVKIAVDHTFSITFWIIAVFAFICHFCYKVNPIYIILSAIAAGIINEYLL